MLVILINIICGILGAVAGITFMKADIGMSQHQKVTIILAVLTVINILTLVYVFSVLLL